ncbi:MAG: hypothetical protein LAT51_05650 [Flavobacteriaceae bacterium]|nr:hypothetical protein [Flavobacteriaceae bacterium]
MYKTKYINLTFFFLTLIVLLTPKEAFAQEYFAGKITYQVNYKSPDGHTNASYLAQENQIDSIVYYIQKGNYKSETFFEGELTESYVFHQNSKWVHYQFLDKDYYLSIDATTEQMNQAWKFNWLNEEEVILNYTTTKAEVTQGYQKENIFYADEIRVNPEDFKTHNYAHWYTTLKATNGRLPLKNLYFDANYIEIKEAIKVEHIEFEPDFFEPNPKFLQVVYREILEQEAQLKTLSASAEECYNNKVEEIEGKLILGKNDHYLLQVVVDENGQPIKAKSMTNKEEFYKVAEEIVLQCGFEFEPAVYQNKTVKSELYIPIQL